MDEQRLAFTLGLLLSRQAVHSLTLQALARQLPADVAENVTTDLRTSATRHMEEFADVMTPGSDKEFTFELNRILECLAR